MNKIQCFLDTNAIARFVVVDDIKKAEIVSKALAKQNCVVPDVVYCEIEYVLRRIYGFSRKKMIKVYQSFIGDLTIKSSIKADQAFEIYQNSNIEMTDCFILVETGGNDLLTFDKKMQRVFKK